MRRLLFCGKKSYYQAAKNVKTDRCDIFVYIKYLSMLRPLLMPCFLVYFFLDKERT